jgi:polar amino acid transport system substrate-binding protein
MTHPGAPLLARVRLADVSTNSLLRLALLVLCGTLAQSESVADTLDDLKARGTLVWGGDQEGGGPYIFPNPDDPGRVVGFEVDLAEALARELGVKSQFKGGLWDNLPDLLRTGSIDIVLNGYELTGTRAKSLLHSSPYFVYQLVLLGRRDNRQLRGWDDLARPPTGRRWRVGVLGTSAARTYLTERYPDSVELVTYEGNLDAMREVELSKLDATIADTPVYPFYRQRFAALQPLGEPVEPGYYVIYLRKGDERLRGAIDQALKKLLDSGDLKSIYEKYGLWSPEQDRLASLIGASDTMLGVRGAAAGGWQAVIERGPLLAQSALVTIMLACASMPLAIVIGLAVAIGRLYGPRPLAWLLASYVEFLRGTPLLLQLYFLFYLLPEVGIGIPAIAAAILGLAINYSAYEAEIYRAGILAIPGGQMEAALALGMTRATAIRRIIVPQAVRLVIPPVTNDFIALFKDTSVCSVITVVELTKQYSIQRNDTGATVELAILTSVLYLLMSLPLSWITSRMERRH